MNADALTGKIFGWREWNVSDVGDLIPVGVGGDSWLAGVNTARCRYHEHPAPDHDCECGLYARYGWDQVGDSDRTTVVGVVAAWGEVELHADGFRAEYAEVLCLVCGLGVSPLDRMVVEYVADRYGVQVLNDRAARAVAMELAREVPAEMRPERRERDVSSAISIGPNPQAMPSQRWPGFVQRLLASLAPRPVKLGDNTVIQNCRIKVTSTLTVGQGCTIRDCFLEGVPFHPGKVAWGLILIGIWIGVALEVALVVVLR